LEKKAHLYRRESRLSIGAAMLLIAGAAVGLWLGLGESRSMTQADQDPESRFAKWVFVFAFVLGGFSLVGPVLLLVTARRRSWRAGRLLWFAQGTAAWLLWPPVVYHRVAGGSQGSMSGMCFFYGTPLMAVYVTLALFAGGHFRRSRRRRMIRSWQETFGVVLGLAWACTGLYLISVFYRQDFFGK
jgi:hypothetical protein